MFLKIKILIFFSNPRRVILYAHKNNENNEKKISVFRFRDSLLRCSWRKYIVINHTASGWGRKLKKGYISNCFFLLVFLFPTLTTACGFTKWDALITGNASLHVAIYFSQSVDKVQSEGKTVLFGKWTQTVVV